MAARYLLSCSNCSTQNPVVARQSGWTIQCTDCEQDILVPKLRTLKELPLAEGSSNEQADKSSVYGRSRTKSWLFVAGLLMGMLGLGAWGGIQYYTSSMISDIDSEDELNKRLAGFDDMSAVELWVAWDELGEIELGAWQEDDRVTDNKLAQLLRNIGYAPLAMGILGVLMFLGSFFVKR